MINLLAWIGLATAIWAVARTFSQIGKQIQSPRWRSLLSALLSTIPLVIGGFIGANWHDLSWGSLSIFLLVLIAMGSMLVGIEMAYEQARQEALNTGKDNAHPGTVLPLFDMPAKEEQMESEIGKCPALSGCGSFDDDDLKGFLSQFPDASEIDLSGSHVTSAGMATIVLFTELRELDLSNTAVDDTAVPALETLSRLVRLDVSNTSISPFGLNRLRKALEPGCTVTSQDQSGS